MHNSTRKRMKAKLVCNVVAILAMFAAPCFATLGDGELHIVVLTKPPVISYNGEIPGLKATRPLKGAPFEPNSMAAVQYSSALLREQTAVLHSLGSKKPVTAVTNSINAFGVKLQPREVEILRARRDVLRVVKSRIHQIQTTSTSDLLSLPSSLWKTNGGNRNAGEGIVIGVIDTGIYPEHPSFSDKGFSPLKGWKGKCIRSKDFKCNNKIVSADYFVNGYLQQGGTIDNEFLSPRARNGHGCHTAGIAAGNFGVPVTMNGLSYGNASGIAPRARLGIYKALWEKDGSAYGSTLDLVAALDRAISDGCNVLSFSVGGEPIMDNTAFLDPIELQFLAAYKAGVLAAASAGNSGPEPYSSDKVGPWYLSVASSTTRRSETKNVTIRAPNGTSITLSGTSNTVGVPKYTRIISGYEAHSIHAFGDTCEYKLDLIPSAVKGNIIICNFRPDAASDAADAVSRLGGVGIIFNGTAEMPWLSRPFPIPVVFFGPASTRALNKFIRNVLRSSSNRSGCVSETPSTPSSMAAKDERAQRVLAGFPCNPTTRDLQFRALMGPHINGRIKTAPQVSSFSSCGPNVGSEYILKPDILAPGEEIISAWTMNSQSPSMFRVSSGTSMAAPHVAGVLALLRQRHRSWSPSAIYSFLLTRASKVNSRNTPITWQGVTAGGFQMGHGFVSPWKLTTPGLVHDMGMPQISSFLCSIGLNNTDVLAATRIPCGRRSPPLDINIPSITLDGSRTNARVVIRKTVTNRGPRGTYKATTHPPPGLTLGGFSVQVSPRVMNIANGGNATYTVTLTPATPKGDVTSGFITWSNGVGDVVTIPINYFG